MTRRPFDPRVADTEPVELDPVARELERYADLTAGELPHGFTERLMASVAAEPTPRRGLLVSLFGPFDGGGRAPRFLFVGATMALGALAVVLAGQIAGLLPDAQIGPSPNPSVIELPSVSPSPSQEPSRTPRATRSPRPSPAGTESPSPTATDDDDERETPKPSDGDNSGSGGGGDDNSGPGGGGGDDNSGPGGGGGDDNSGPGGGGGDDGEGGSSGPG